MAFYTAAHQNVAQDGAVQMVWMMCPMPIYSMPPPAPIEINKQPRVVCSFQLGGITVLIRHKTVRHIMTKHSKDFFHASNGATDFQAEENNVSQFIKETITSSQVVTVTDAGRTKQNSLLVTLKRPLDNLSHRFIITHEAGDVYRLETAYKLSVDASFFSLPWKEWIVGGQYVYTAAVVDSCNPYIARIRGNNL